MWIKGTMLGKLLKLPHLKRKRMRFPVLMQTTYQLVRIIRLKSSQNKYPKLRLNQQKVVHINRLFLRRWIPQMHSEKRRMHRQL